MTRRGRDARSAGRSPIASVVNTVTRTVKRNKDADIDVETNTNTAAWLPGNKRIRASNRGSRRRPQQCRGPPGHSQPARLDEGAHASRPARAHRGADRQLALAGGARTSIRSASFAHMISSTNPTAAIRMMASRGRRVQCNCRGSEAPGRRTRGWFPDGRVRGARNRGGLGLCTARS